MKGRKRPYTEEELATTACGRCGQIGCNQQFEVCALGRRHVPLCARCDVELNHIVLLFMGFPNALRIADEYRRNMGLALEKL